MSKARPNFARLNSSRPDVAVIISAMLAARQAVERRSCVSPIEPTGDYWWANVLADPRARSRRHSQVTTRLASERAYCTLADEPRSPMKVPCTKCIWQTDFNRAELIARFGSDYPLYPMQTTWGSRGEMVCTSFIG